MNYLYVAYGVTWAIHILYLVFLTSDASHLKKEVEELKKR